jgi:hypothetical protein
LQIGVEEAAAVVAVLVMAVTEAEVVVVFLFVVLFFLVVVAATEVVAVVTAVEVGAVVVVVRWLPAAAAKVVVEALENAARMEEAPTEMMGTYEVAKFEASLVGLASATLAVEMVASSCPLPIKPAIDFDGENDKLLQALSVLVAAELSIIGCLRKLFQTKKSTWNKKIWNSSGTIF